MSAVIPLPRDAFKPPSSEDIGPGLVLAALVHVGLVVAIAFGVRWHAREPEGLQAELWAAVPQVAAPRAAEPEPEPPRVQPPKPVPKAEPTPPPKVVTPDPQIAIEKLKQDKLKEQHKREEEQAEKKKAQEEKLKADKLEAERRKKEEAHKDELLAAQREANIKRILGEAGATGSTPGTAARTAGPSAAYAGRIKARIKPNILLTDSVEGNPLAEVEVRCSPDGTIIASKLIKSSGVKEWDEAVLRAIDKTEILPRDTDGTVPSPMVIAFRPHDF